MLDRLISGAGALTDGADRSVRALSGGSRNGFCQHTPRLAAGRRAAGHAGRATDPRRPRGHRPLDPGLVGARRGRLVAGSRRPDVLDDPWRPLVDLRRVLQRRQRERGRGCRRGRLVWYYWLVDRDARAGVTVRSTRPPESLFTFRGSGVLIDEPAYARESFDPYDDDAQRAGLSIEPDVVLDTTNGFTDAPAALDLAGPLPPTGTTVELSGARLGSYIGVCRHDPSVDPSCPSDEQACSKSWSSTGHPATRSGPWSAISPEFTDDADLTGLLRREERAVDDARTGAQVDFSDLDLTVSDRYVLDEAVAAGTAPLTFALAGLVAAVAGVILVGWAGGYLIYRRSDGGLPAPATSLGAGERIPLRITGVLRTPTGLEHVREAPGALIRFVLGRPVTTSHAVDEVAGEPAEADDRRRGGGLRSSSRRSPRRSSSSGPIPRRRSPSDPASSPGCRPAR